MKCFFTLILTLLFAAQPCAVLAQEKSDVIGPDTRLYLTNGTVIMGELVRRDDDLIIMRVKGKIHTFGGEEVSRLVDLNSMGSAAKTITVREFPYISFLGGAVAFSVISWLQFDRASDRDKSADINAGMGIDARARKLRDQADRARLYGWGSAVLAAGSLGVSLIPRKATRRMFPELSVEQGTSTLMVSYVHRF